MGLKSDQIKRIAGILNSKVGRVDASERKATQATEVWDKLDILKEFLGADDLLDELLRAMSTEEANENFDFIAQMHDISFDPSMEVEGRKQSDSYERKTTRRNADEQRAEYYQSMRALAKDLLQEAQEEAQESGEDVEDIINEKISYWAGESEWVISTEKALSVLNNSDNWLAVEDVTGEEITPKITEWAVYAVEADLWEYVRAFLNEGVPEDL